MQFVRLDLPFGKLFFGLIFLLALGALGNPLLGQNPRMLEVELRDSRIQGLPVHWGKYDAALLESDGKFHVFDLPDVRRHALLDIPFVPESLAHARASLQAELGGAYETMVAGPYVIAAPRGTVRRWQSRFTALLAGYQRYFEVRGWALRQSDFPLVIVVFATRAEFLGYCRTQTNRLPAQAVGSYFAKSNRCVLYQIEGVGGTNWSETEATVVHEAVHQLAYNTGVHERLFENPTWFVEGLATMFEQSNVYDLRASSSTITSRIHSQKLAKLQPLLRQPAQLETLVRGLIASDSLFSSDGATAYTVSWAMTFYLAERMPRQFQQFISLQSRRRFGSYSAGQRRQDFQTAFQSAPSMLVQQMTRLFERR